jgi:hypothetical protein
MNLSWNGLLALLGCLIMAIIPLPRSAEGVRLGFFAAILALVLADSSRKRAKARDSELVPLMVHEGSSEGANPTADRADRLRRASRLLEPASSTSNQWRRFGQLARSRELGVRTAA